MNECKRTPSIVFKSSADVIPSGDDITPSGRAEERADLVGTKLGRVLGQASDIEGSDVGSIAGEAVNVCNQHCKGVAREERPT